MEKKQKKQTQKKVNKQKYLKPWNMLIMLIAIVAVSLGGYFIFFHNQSPELTKSEAVSDVKDDSETSQSVSTGMLPSQEQNSTDQKGTKKKATKKEPANKKPDQGLKSKKSEKTSQEKAFKMAANGMTVDVTFNVIEDTIQSLRLNYNVNYQDWGITDKEAESEIATMLGIEDQQAGVESSVSTKNNEVILDMTLDYSKIDKKLVELLFGVADDSFSSMEKTEKLLLNQGYQPV